MNSNSFWLTNISNRNVSLADLALTVKAYTSVNLLDKKHYQYTKEQLEKSAKEGSIFKKRHLLKVRKLSPVQETSNILIDREALVPSRQRSIFNIKEEKYEELEMTDEEFVQEMTEEEPKPTK